MSQREDGTRERILAAAGEIFARQGFEGTTIRNICERAEVNLAAVNYHFGDKQRLYKATIRHAHEMATVQAPLPEWTDETPPEVKLRGFIHTMVQRMLVVKKLPWQTQLMMRELVQPSEACIEIVEDYIRPHHRMLARILAELAPEGTPSHRLDQLAFSVVGQCLFYKMHPTVVSLLIPEDELRQRYQPQQLAEHVADVMLAALNPHSAININSDVTASPGRSHIEL